jgi:hypothetical protein
MAKADEPGPKHNQYTDAEKMAAIAEVSREIGPMIAERNELREEVSGKTKAINGKVRALKHHGITARRFWALREIAQMDEDEDIAAAVQEIRLCAAALLPGEQAALFVSVDDVKAAKKKGGNGKGDTAKARTPGGRKTSCFDEGYAASVSGEAGSQVNPHDEGTDQHDEWQEGWQRHQAELADGMKPEGAAAH